MPSRRNKSSYSKEMFGEFAEICEFAEHFSGQYSVLLRRGASPLPLRW